MMSICSTQNDHPPMIELELTDEEAATLRTEVETSIDIAAEAGADDTLRTLTAVQRKLDAAMDEQPRLELNV